jgi:hypothetical protein
MKLSVENEACGVIMIVEDPVNKTKFEAKEFASKEP